MAKYLCELGNEQISDSFRLKNPSIECLQSWYNYDQGGEKLVLVEEFYGALEAISKDNLFAKGFKALEKGDFDAFRRKIDYSLKTLDVFLYIEDYGEGGVCALLYFEKEKFRANYVHFDGLSLKKE